MRRKRLKSLGLDARALVSRAGKTYSYWRDLMGDDKKSFGEKAARSIEEALGLPPGWLDTLPQEPQATIPAQAHALTLDAYTVPPKIEWENLMLLTELPSGFRAAVPDDALAPRVLRGTELIFSTEAAPAPGVGILIRDAAGAVHVRRYAQAPGGGWAAQALNDAYASFPGPEVQLLAVMTGRMTGEV